MKLLNRREERRIAESVIRDPEEHTVFDEHGAVRSVQAADLTVPASDLIEIWTPMYLERLARTYWKYLSRISLGLFRVEYTPTERVVVLVTRPFVLLRFHAPDYELDAGRGIVRWRIKDGLLVDSQGHDADGYLEIDVQRCEDESPGRAKVHVEVEIASFYPAIAFKTARWIYANTQSRIHILVTHGFLRSLARLELEESAVGRFREPAGDSGPVDEKPVNVGDTPWAAVAALAGGAALGLLVVARSRR